MSCVLCVRRASIRPGREASGGAAELEQRRQRRALRPQERERHPSQGQLLCLLLDSSSLVHVSVHSLHFRLYGFTLKMKRDAFVRVCSLKLQSAPFYCDVCHLCCSVHQKAMMNHVLHRQGCAPNFRAFAGLTEMPNCVIGDHLQENKQDVCQDCRRLAFKLERQRLVNFCSRWSKKIKVMPKNSKVTPLLKG